MPNPAAAIGRRANEFLANLAQFLALFYATVMAVLRLRFKGGKVVFRVLLNQVRFTGAHALVPVSIASLAIGGLVIMQASTYLPADIVVGVVPPIILREIVPLLTALILIGRSGTAIAIEIANMKLNEELAAIMKMGIPIEHFVFFPRLAGMVVSFIVLVIYADIAALFGGFYLARLTGVTPIQFNFPELLNGIQAGDIGIAALKVVIFGIVIALTSIQYGLRVTQSVREVPIVTTTAVVRSMIACLLINTFVSVYV